jgi:hypothetical protein
MSITWTTWQQQVAVLCGVPGTSSAFQTEVPAAIDYAEQRIYRELNLINTITTDATTQCVANARFITIPSAFVVLNSLNVLLPFGNTNPLTGNRGTLDRVSLDYINWVYPPGSTSPGQPAVYANVTQYQFAIGPNADNTYNFEAIGTQRPAPLSATNASTFLTLNLPDLFEAATMIHFSGQMKNFGAQADDPRTAVSWEALYTKLAASADAEELRKRYTGTSIMPPPGAARPAAAA